MKPKFIKYYMQIADLTGQLSYAKRLQVGAIVVKGNRIISSGYNGTPAGWDNQCEHLVELAEGSEGVLRTKDEVLHAEFNAIIKLARDGESGDGATLFCTHAPCIECAKLIYGSGIARVFYREVYRTDAGVRFLEHTGIEITRYGADTGLSQQQPDDPK